MSVTEQLTLELQPPFVVRRRPSLAFWHPMTGELDRKYLRVCSVYRLLRRKKIGKARAMELLAQKHNPKEMMLLKGTVELWASGPIKDMAA